MSQAAGGVSNICNRYEMVKCEKDAVSLYDDKSKIQHILGGACVCMCKTIERS